MGTSGCILEFDPLYYYFKKALEVQLKIIGKR
jgi:hypothetical protein